MSRKRHEEPEKENNERWLLTYSDLITLLMIFFVVLYSMSKIDADKFRAIADSLNKSLGGSQPSKMEIANNPNGPAFLDTGNMTSKATQPGKSNNPDNTSDNNLSAQSSVQSSEVSQGNIEAENMSIEAIKAKVDKFARDNDIETKLISSIEERGLVVSIQDTLLFDSGSATLTPKARSILEKIAVVLNGTPNFIRVEGHTDNLPIHTPQFPSNWELSASRATNVVQLMIDSGGISPERLSEIGYSQYRPIMSNDTEAGRSRNRRVDLIILRSKYDAVEPSSSNASATSPETAPKTSSTPSPFSVAQTP